MHRKAVKTIAICTRALNSNPRCPLLSALATHIGSWCIDFVSMGAVLHDHMAYYHLMMDIPSSVTFHALTDNIVYTVLILLMFKTSLALTNSCFFFFCFTKIQIRVYFYTILRLQNSCRMSYIIYIYNIYIYLYLILSNKIIVLLMLFHKTLWSYISCVLNLWIYKLTCLQISMI